jgi:MFS family permease
VEGTAKKLPVSAILLAMLAAVIGGVIGALAGLLVGSLLASAMHVPAREGESGYFIIFIGLIGIILATPTAVLLTLVWRGLRRLWLLIGFVVTFAAIFIVAASAFGVWYLAQPHILNANGPTPRLEFEVKLRNGIDVQTLANIQAELDTDRNVMPADWSDPTKNQNSAVRAGAVDLYFRTSQRLFVLKFPGQTDRIFQLKIPANPMKAKYRAWSDWQNPEFVAKPDSQPTRFSGNADYQIRYRVDYQE